MKTKNFFVEIAVPAWALVFANFLLFISYVLEVQEHVGSVIETIALASSLLVSSLLVFGKRVQENDHEKEKSSA